MTDDSEVMNDKEVETVLDRRKLFRRLVALAGLGITGVLLSQDKTGILPEVHAFTDMAIDSVNSGSATTELDSSIAGGPAFVVKATGSGSYGITGSGTGTGVTGTGVETGVAGIVTATSGVGGTGVYGQSSSPNGQGIYGVAASPTTIPIVAQGDSGQTSPLQEWQNSSGTALSAVGAQGSFRADYAALNNGSALAPGIIFGGTASGEGISSNRTSSVKDLEFWTNNLQRLTITNAGNVGIGTTTPTRSVHLQGGNACFRMDRDVDSSAFILVRTAPSGNFSTVWKTFYVGVNASGVNDGSFFIGDVGSNVSGASTVRLQIDNNGNVGIGSIAGSPPFSNILTLPNTASPAGRGLANAWSTYSSIRWKTNIQPIQGALDLIGRLRGVRFNWKVDGKEDVGLVAEEVGQVVPEIVTYEKNGRDAQSLDYSRLVPVTVEAIKEQQRIIEQQEGEIGQLRTENNRLREQLTERIEVLERKLAAS